MSGVASFPPELNPPSCRSFLFLINLKIVQGRVLAFGCLGSLSLIFMVRPIRFVTSSFKISFSTLTLFTQASFYVLFI